MCQLRPRPANSGKHTVPDVCAAVRVAITGRALNTSKGTNLVLVGQVDGVGRLAAGGAPLGVLAPAAGALWRCIPVLALAAVLQQISRQTVSGCNTSHKMQARNVQEAGDLADSATATSLHVSMRDISPRTQGGWRTSLILKTLGILLTMSRSGVTFSLPEGAPLPPLNVKSIDSSPAAACLAAAVAARVACLGPAGASPCQVQCQSVERCQQRMWRGAGMGQASTDADPQGMQTMM
jgi:hypothetical protein